MLTLRRDVEDVIRFRTVPATRYNATVKTKFATSASGNPDNGNITKLITQPEWNIAENSHQLFSTTTGSTFEAVVTRNGVDDGQQIDRSLPFE